MLSELFIKRREKYCRIINSLLCFNNNSVIHDANISSIFVMISDDEDEGSSKYFQGEKNSLKMKVNKQEMFLNYYFIIIIINIP